MIIALAVEKNNFDSELSEVFGRSKFILVYNSENQSKKIIPNPFAAAFDGAGIQTSQLLIENNCDVLIVQNIHNQALVFLESVGIKVYKSAKVKTPEAITLHNEGKLKKIIAHSGFGKGRRKRHRNRGNH